MSIATLLRVGPWLAILLLTGLLAVQNDRVKSWKQTAELCAQGREADRETYEAAQAKAKADNIAHVREVEKQQERINAETVSDLNSRLERLRSELRQRASASQGNSGPAGSPAVPAPAGSAPGEAGMCLAAADVLRGAENEERHEQLIRWVEEQLKVVR